MDIGDHYPYKTRPYTHQSRSLRMSEGRVEYAFFMDMGTGKSKVIIDDIARIFDSCKIDSALIVAPKGVYMNWVLNEIPTHLPDHIGRLVAAWSSAPRKEQRIALNRIRMGSSKLRILVMNVEAFSTKKGFDFAMDFLLEAGKVYMAVDESTTIKNMTAKRTKNIIKLGRKAEIRRILTGSPVTRSPLDVYAQFAFLNPKLLGFSSYFSFRARYAILINMTAGNRTFKTVKGYRNVEELTEIVGKHSYRVTKDECLDLPPKVYQYREVELTPEQRRIYDDVSDKGIAVIESEIMSIDLMLTQILRLHQITCGHFVPDDPDAETVLIPNNRIRELMSVIEEAGDAKIIIWGSYISDIRAIIDQLTQDFGRESVVGYYGAVKQDDRNTAIERFQKDPECRFFVGNPQTGSMGITLTAASVVIYYSNSYNLEHRLQSEDRAHRIGQEKSVLYVDLISPKTIDQKIVKALRDKKNIAQQVMGDEWKEWLR